MPVHVTKLRRSRMGRKDRGGRSLAAAQKGTDGSWQTHSDLEEGFFTFGLFRRWTGLMHAQHAYTCRANARAWSQTHAHTHRYACPHTETHTHPHKHSRNKQLASLQQQHEKTGSAEEAGLSASPSLTSLPARMLQPLRSEHWEQRQAGWRGSISVCFVACVVFFMNGCQRGGWVALGRLSEFRRQHKFQLLVKVINTVVMRANGQGGGRIPVFADVVSLFSPWKGSGWNFIPSLRIAGETVINHVCASEGEKWKGAHPSPGCTACVLCSPEGPWAVDASHSERCGPGCWQHLSTEGKIKVEKLAEHFFF